jgi:hypothetical protein
MRFDLAAAAAAVALCVACGMATEPQDRSISPTGPTALSPPRPVGAPDLEQLAAAVAAELRDTGLDVIVAERLSGAPLNVPAQRLEVRTAPPGSIRVYGYGTVALAQQEASRIDESGNLRPEPGQPPYMHADYIERQHFYYRDRVIAAVSGCAAPTNAAMVALFGLPIVVTHHPCR